MEARNAAMAAAGRNGLTLGEWLDRAIRQQVKADHSQLAPTIEQTLAKLAESMAQQNAAIAARLEAVERREQESGRFRPANPFAWLYGLFWPPAAPPKPTPQN